MAGVTTGAADGAGSLPAYLVRYSSRAFLWSMTCPRCGAAVMNVPISSGVKRNRMGITSVLTLRVAVSALLQRWHTMATTDFVPRLFQWSQRR